MRPADLDNRATHEAAHSRRTATELVTRFGALRSAWVGRLLALDTEAFAARSRHPRLDRPMRLVDLCGFVAAHDDCHLARIRALVRSQP